MIYGVGIGIGIVVVVVFMLMRGPFAYKSMGSKLRRIEKIEKKTGVKLSAREKIQMLK